MHVWQHVDVSHHFLSQDQGQAGSPKCVCVCEKTQNAFTFTSRRIDSIEALITEQLKREKNKVTAIKANRREKKGTLQEPMAFKYPAARRDETKVSVKVPLFR